MKHLRLYLFGFAFIAGSAIGGILFWLLLVLLTGCKTPPPDRPYAHDEAAPVTEQPRESRPVPVAPKGAYVPYTNSQQDRLIEDYRIPLSSVHTNTLTNIHFSTNIYMVISNGARHQILGPPVLPGRGPFPTYVVPQTTISNWMTPKAMAVQPKLVGTNQIPGSVILSRITTTGSDGKPFTATLELQGNQTIQGNDKMAVIIFALAHTNYTVQVCTNLTEGKWMPFSSGVSQTPSGAIVLVDLHEGTSPLKFYRQVETK